MKLEKEFVPYELAVKLKELGFDEKCFSVYDTMGFHQDEREMNLLLLDYIKAPLWQQAFDWLRVEHLVHEQIVRGFNLITKKEYWSYGVDSSVGTFNNYEEARYACLEKLIELTTCKSEN